MVATIFFEDFDGNGVGFSGPPFESWSIGGDPIGAGNWQLFYPDMDPAKPNLSPGSGRYAAVRSESFEFLDTLVWLISPVIDVRMYKNLVLSTDLYFKTQTVTPDDRFEVLLLRVGKEPEMIAFLETTHGHPIKDTMKWNLNSDCEFIQIAFTYTTATDGGNFDSIQLDNIRITGEPDCSKA